MAGGPQWGATIHQEAPSSGQEWGGVGGVLEREQILVMDTKVLQHWASLPHGEEKLWQEKLQLVHTAVGPWLYNHGGWWTLLFLERLFATEAGSSWGPWELHGAPR